MYASTNCDAMLCADEDKAGLAGGCCRSSGRKPVQASGPGESPHSVCSRASFDAQEQEGRERCSGMESPSQPHHYPDTGGGGEAVVVGNGFSELANGNCNGPAPGGRGSSSAAGRHEVGGGADGRAGKHRAKSSPEHGASSRPVIHVA